MEKERTTSESPVSLSDVTQQPWWMRYFIYIVGVALIVMLFWIIGGLWPFDPYKFGGYVDLPSEVCAGEPLDVDYILEIEGGPYTIGKLEGEGYLLDMNNRPLDAYPIDVDMPNSLEKTVVASQVTRVAPTYSGVFRVGADVRLNGYIFGFVPNHQDLKVKSEQTIRVLPLDDPACATTEGS